MKRNGALLEPVPEGQSLWQAKTLKLTAELISKLMGRPQMSIKLTPSEKVFTIGEEQFSLEEVKEETGSHDVYLESKDSIVRVASIRSRLNIHKTLNQQVAAEVREKTQQAELAYRGNKIGSVDEAAATHPSTAVTSPSLRKRRVAPTAVRPGAPGQKPGMKPAVKVPKPVAKVVQPIVAKDLRRQLIHLLAAADKGLSQTALEKQMALPMKEFKFQLSMVSTSEKDVYKLNPTMFKDVDPNYDGYTAADRAMAMNNKQKSNLEASAAVKPAVKPDKVAKTSPNHATSEPTTKKRKPANGEIAPESVELAKSSACPEEIPLNKLKLSEKYAKSLPEITNPKEYESYRRTFNLKHDRYKELDQKLVANSKEFADLAHQFEKCTDRQEKKRLKDVIFQRIAQKKLSHQQMVVEWKGLHVELTEIKDRVSAYVQEYQQTLT